MLQSTELCIISIYVKLDTHKRTEEGKFFRKFCFFEYREFNIMDIMLNRKLALLASFVFLTIACRRDFFKGQIEKI